MGMQRKREINRYLVSKTNQSSEAPKKKEGRLCQPNWRKLQCSLLLPKTPTLSLSLSLSLSEGVQVRRVMQCFSIPKIHTRCYIKLYGLLKWEPDA